MTLIDTNCTGCNSVKAGGTSVQQFSATLAGGGAALVAWAVSGGDAVSGTGTINANGQYTPPSYLTADRAEVLVTSTLESDSPETPVAKASSLLTIMPGFLQPLTPENLALGANGSTTITGVLAEAGGNTEINFALSNSANSQSTAQSGGTGSLSPASCLHSSTAFTSCSVTYTAPAAVSASGATYVVATVGNSRSKTTASVLLNTAGVSSNPATHQAQLLTLAQLGTSGGNNNDYDAHGNRVVDCCGGTLGALIEDGSGRQFVLSNNHVLASSDQAAFGDTIVQPGLIDNNCNPNGAGTVPVAWLQSWLPLRAKATNADAAIAQVASRTIDPTGSILELGTRQADGTLAAAPPGISSTAGKGETAGLNLQVAKSGRTTGLTCSSVTALALDVSVDYFTDCAETQPYLTKTFTNQLAVSGNAFSDAGDSGALLVDAANAEPVGLLFAGGLDTAGVSQAIANPAFDVLSELGAQAGGATYSFVGTNDHAVSCLNYGDNTVNAAQARTLGDSELVRSQQAISDARALVNPSAGILGVSMGKSTDNPGESAVIVYVDESANVTVPPTVNGVRTLVIPSTVRAVAFGSGPLTPAAISALPVATLNAAVAVKQRVAAGLMKHTSAFFGVGVGQSLDSPKEAALIIYVDRKQLPTQLAPTVGGLRTRYVVMDRLHVTRSYANATPSRVHCFPNPMSGQTGNLDPIELSNPLQLK
jgi:hypothetical protein